MRDTIVFPSAFDPADESESVTFSKADGGALIVCVRSRFVDGDASLTISREDASRLVDFLLPESMGR